MGKYNLPEFLKGIIDLKDYRHWLKNKAISHSRRDRGRGNKKATIEKYKVAVHNAVIKSKGIDAYTKEKLDWKLINKYENKKAHEGGRIYKRKFDLLPSVDHIGDGKGKPDFKICAMRTNCAKSDLSYKEFVDLCKIIIKNNK